MMRRPPYGPLPPGPVIWCRDHVPMSAPVAGVRAVDTGDSPDSIC